MPIGSNEGGGVRSIGNVDRDDADIVWRGFYDAQVERLLSHYGQRDVHITISERVFLSNSQRDAAYNQILTFIGVPVVSDYAAVFSRPGSYFAQNETLTLTLDAALFLRRLYVNDTKSSLHSTRIQGC